MAVPMAEYCDSVVASDVHDYGHGRVLDFMACDPVECDWIITNPPFNIADAFAVRALGAAKRGVALLCRLQFLESRKRYREVFAKHPPSVAVFTERVAFQRGYWDPGAPSAVTCYSWFVWTKPHRAPTVMWVPPGAKEALSRESDADVLPARDRAIHDGANLKETFE